MRLLWAKIALLAVGLVGAVLWGLQDFDPPPGSEVDFAQGGNTLRGTLFLPHPGAPVAIIVHGDGPQDRLSDGGYLPLINALYDAGIGSFSWDKPGIGASTGDWLDQSMADRAAEARAARAAILQHTGLAPGQVGYLGFSQAGWAVPRAAAQDRPGFSVLIGAAVNWRDQGRYFEQVALTRQGLDPAEIAQRLAAREARDAAQFAPGAPVPAGVDPARFGFVARAYHADASADIARMQGPVLALWGLADLNVDAGANAARYAQLRPDIQVQILDGAGHSLLRAPLFNTQLPSDWSLMKRGLFLALGRRAYAPGALGRITGWIQAQTAPL